MPIRRLLPARADAPRRGPSRPAPPCGTVRRRAGAVAVELAVVLAVSTLPMGAGAAADPARAQGATAAPRAARAGPTGMADYIVAVVNQELVTNAELQARIGRMRAQAEQARQALPPADALRKLALDSLIDERVQVTNAREIGPKIDEAEVDRAVANVAAQNQLTLPQLRERLQQQGLPYGTFRNNVKDQILVERVREHEVNDRIKISDAEIDALIDQRRAESRATPQVDLAQILIPVADGAPADEVARRQAIAESALARVRRGEDFATVARELSEDGNRARGGEIGMKPLDRLPDVFVEATRGLKPGDVTPALLRSGAGFHVLKVLARQDGGALVVTQTHARHILLRVSPELTPEAAARRLLEMKQQIASGARTFEQLARQYSEDGSAAAGGDLGWAQPGSFVPEFQEAMDKLPLNGVSDPVASRFGVHLIQVLDRRDVTLDAKQAREQARAVLREQKFDAAYADWTRDLRGRAYIELREPPV